MTSKIKQRIEQIRRGEVPEGYQKTKNGIFPADWRTQKMKQWVALAERPVTLEDDKRYRLVTVRRGFGGVDLRGEYLGKDILVKNYFKVRQGDFLISKRQISHGACGVVPESLDGAVVSNEYNVFVPNQGTNIEMFNLMMRLPHYTRLFYLMSDGVHIEKLLFKTQDWTKRKLAMPPIAEQQKIAVILTTQDKVIELKEKRLAEKQRQKKYLMQQLLTGKKRLPGFSQDWEKKSFDEVFTFGATNTFSRECMCEDSAGIKNIHYGDILVRYGEVLKLSEQEIPSLLSDIDAKITTFVDDGDVIIADTAEDLTAGKVVEVQETHGKKVAAGLHTMLCKPTKGCFAPGWLGYYMNSETYHKQLIPYIAGVKVMSISKGNILNTHILVPLIEEQAAIVRVFSAADREIELLRQDIEQEKQKKKALMQLLLTGIVRVKA